MLDEPFSALDYELKEGLMNDIKKLIKSEKITAILITHSAEEAFKMSDKIAFISENTIMQYADPYDLYHKPASKEIANFFGISSYIKATVKDSSHLSSILGDFVASTEGYNTGDEVRMLVRPDDIIHDDDAITSARVIEKTFRGSDFLYRLELKDNVMLTFGETRDLQISHNGSDSIIKDAGVGRLKILGGFQVKNVGDTQTLITANTSGASATNVELYHANTLKFETVSTGASTYGQLNVARLNGGTSDLSQSYGALRYGNENAAFNYSTRKSLDLLNYDFLHKRNLLFGTPEYVVNKINELKSEFSISKLLDDNL